MGVSFVRGVDQPPKVLAQGLCGSCIPNLRALRIGLVTPSIGQSTAFETPAVSLLATHLHAHVDLEIFAVRQPHDADTADAPHAPSQLRITSPSRHEQSPRARDILRRTVQHIIAAHRRRPFDLLHGLWLYESGAAAVIAGRLLRVPVVVSIGGAEVAHLPQIGYGMRQSWRGRLIVRQVLRGATAVTGGSSSVLRLADIAAGCTLASRRIPLPIDAAAFERAHQHAPAAQSLVHIGAMLPVKNQDLLLRTLREVRLHLPDVRLTLLGEDPHGMTPALLRQAQDLGIAEALHIAGRVPHAQLPDALAGHVLHVQTSRHESQGLGVLEAAAAGIPSVGTAVGALADLAPDAAVALWQPDPALLANAIVDTLNNADALALLRQHAIERVQASYDVDPVIAEWLALYARLAKRQR